MKRLTKDQKKAIEYIKNGNNVFITGPGGTGKSFLIKKICNKLSLLNISYSILAPTGVSAMNVGGVTIHKFLGMDINNNINFKKDIYDKIRNTETIIIDEISMINSNVFSKFDYICRSYRKNKIIFGGIQLILIGDFFQLSPVPDIDNRAKNEKPKYIFETEIWNKLNLKYINLIEIKRQTDSEFISILNDVRYGIYSKRLQNLINKCNKNIKKENKHYIKLYTNNKLKKNANEEELSKIDKKEHKFIAKDFGDKDLLKGCIAEKEIILKVGCPVMLLKNYDQYNLYNGSIGHIMNFDKKTGYSIVKFESEILCISTDEWEINELIIYEDDNNNLCKDYITLAKRIQIPLGLAWAITIHKSQGLTFKYLEVILTNTFTEGQMYVALSRAVSMENLIISGFKKSHLKVNNNVIKFYEEEILEKYIIDEISNIKI